MAQSGNIESLYFDEINKTVASKDDIGVEASVNFAIAVWNGDDFETAVERSILIGLQNGGELFVSALISKIGNAGVASIGAAIGSLIPIIGTATGALVGGKIGSLLSTASNISKNIFNKNLTNELTDLKYIKMPSSKDWLVGLYRILKAIAKNKRIKHTISPSQMAAIMHSVQQMNQTLMKTEQTLEQMKVDECNYNAERQHIMNERTQLKNRLSDLMKDDGGW